MKISNATLLATLLLVGCGNNTPLESDRAYAYVLEKSGGPVLAEKDIPALGACVDSARQKFVAGSKEGDPKQEAPREAAMGLDEFALAYQKAGAVPADVREEVSFFSVQVINAAYANCDAIVKPPKG